MLMKGVGRVHRRWIGALLVLGVVALAQVVGAAALAAGAHGGQPWWEGKEGRELRAHTLSVEKVRRYVDATERLHALYESDPFVRRLLEEMDDLGEDPSASLGDLIRVLHAEPTLRGAIEGAGLSARDFVYTQATLLPAYIIASMRAAGMAVVPPGLTSEQHIEFARRHRAEIEALLVRLQRPGGTVEPRR
jgi:hypothetical protein